MDSENRRRCARQNLVDVLCPKHTPSASLNDPARNYSGGFHRVCTALIYTMGSSSPTDVSVIKNTTLRQHRFIGQRQHKQKSRTSTSLLCLRIGSLESSMMW